MAMMRFAARWLVARIAMSPTPPSPTTATVVPGPAWAASAANQPVPSTWSAGLVVLVVGDVVAPRHDLPLVVCFLDGDVRHEPVRCGAVPVLLAWFDVDHIAGTDLVHLAAARDVADAVGHIQCLAVGVGVPRRPGAGGEPHVRAADRGLFVGIADAVDVDGAGEPRLGADGGLAAAAGELHDRCLCCFRARSTRGPRGSAGPSTGRSVLPGLLQLVGEGARVVGQPLGTCVIARVDRVPVVKFSAGHTAVAAQ